MSEPLAAGAEAGEIGEAAAAASLRVPIEPFVYFRDHASAIPGLGGTSRSPNPNYCFHTHYLEYAPGVVLFHVRIRDARATCGELEVRVHGYRPDNPGLGIKLVTGTRLALAGIDQEVLEITVRISAIPGVHYAVFGNYAEFGDLRASDVELEAEVRGGELAEDYSDVQVPAIALDIPAGEVASALVTSAPATLRMPGSQACTAGQLESEIFAHAWPELPPAADDGAGARARWRQIYALQVLQQFGFLRTGVAGLALGALPAPLEQVLHERGCLMAARTPEEIADPELSMRSGHYDFLICLDAGAHCESFGGPAGFVAAALRRVLRGGLALFVFDFAGADGARPDTEGAAALARPVVTRPQIERLALRLIGHGSSVAQLGFPSGTGTDVAAAAITPFGLTVRR